jgi:hypothetical protein
VASGPNFEGENSLASGLFGIFQSAASGGTDTATVWANLRSAAGTWAYQAGGGGEMPTEAELEESGRQILKDQGVTIQTVNTYRALAGQWQSAREALASADEGSQITASQIFTPPWANSDTDAVPSRYRVRVNWELTPAAGDVFTKWSSYELTSPLTSLDDILAQAEGKARDDKYLYLLSGGAAPSVSDYEIEQI